MTATTHQRNTQLPLTQNTAPVLEFNCLYTHDLRKKRKIWNDGFLRYHTFNKRVMVYDTPGRNFVGDAHWMSSVLQCGDQVTLERPGVMVEVADEVGRTETDLSELLGPRQARNANGNRNSSPARAPQTPTARTATRPRTARLSRLPAQSKHRSLNALLGASKGPIGKAVLPLKSPYEERQRDLENDGCDQGRPAKRTRVEKPPTKTVHEATVTTEPKPARDQLPKTKNVVQPASPKHATDFIVNEEKAADRFPSGFSSGALAPSTPPIRAVSPRACGRRTATQTTEHSSPPAFQTQKAASMRHAAVDKQPRRSAQDVFDSRSRAEEKQPGKPKRAAVGKENMPPPEPAGSILRVAPSAPKKKMLVCQDQLASKPLGDAADGLLGATSEERRRTENAQERVLAQRRSKAKAGGADGADEHQPSKRKPVAQMTRSLSGPHVAQPAGSVSASSAVQTQAKHAPHEQLSVPNTEQTSAAMPDAPTITATGKKKGNGKREIRASAQACFQKPATETSVARPALDSPVQSYEVLVEAAEPALLPSPPSLPKAGAQVQESTERAGPLAATHNSAEHTQKDHETSEDNQLREQAKPKRMLGAPMRLTPSPRRQSPSRAKPSTRHPVSKSASMQAQNIPFPHQANAVLTSTRSPPAVAEALTSMPPPKPAAHPSKAFKKPSARANAEQLNTSANSGNAAVMLGRPFQAPKMAGASAVGRGSVKEGKKAVHMDVAVELDPWSREAFDLFDWRPPGWDEESWCRGKQSGPQAG